jgi:hypothetical protein
MDTSSQFGKVYENRFLYTGTHESFELIIVGFSEWLRPEVGDELLHAPLAHARESQPRSDGGRAHACDEVCARCLHQRHASAFRNASRTFLFGRFL